MKLNELKLNVDTVKSKLGFNVKKHLLSNEIVNIAEMMLQEENYMTREEIKAIALVDFCTDIEMEFDKEDGSLIINQDIYDILNSHGIIKEVENIIDKRDLALIDKYIEYSESVNHTIKYFCDNISKDIEEQNKNFNMNELLKFLENKGK